MQCSLLRLFWAGMPLESEKFATGVNVMCLVEVWDGTRNRWWLYRLWWRGSIVVSLVVDGCERIAVVKVHLVDKVFSCPENLSHRNSQALVWSWTNMQTWSPMKL